MQQAADEDVAPIEATVPPASRIYKIVWLTAACDMDLANIVASSKAPLMLLAQQITR